MPLSTADLNDFVLNISHLDRKALSEEVSVTQLAKLATAPGVYVTFSTQGYRMALSTCYVDHVDVLKFRNRSDLVLVQDVSMSELATVASSPGKDNAFIVDRSGMVVAQRKLRDLILLEVV